MVRGSLSRRLQHTIIWPSFFPVCNTEYSFSVFTSLENRIAADNPFLCSSRHTPGSQVIALIPKHCAAPLIPLIRRLSRLKLLLNNFNRYNTKSRDIVVVLDPGQSRLHMLLMYNHAMPGPRIVVSASACASIHVRGADCCKLINVSPWNADNVLPVVTASLAKILDVVFDLLAQIVKANSSVNCHELGRIRSSPVTLTMKADKDCKAT